MGEVTVRVALALAPPALAQTGRLRVTVHDPEADDLVFIGKTSRDTEVFFIRRIGLTNDIIGGGRLTGQAGPFSIGLLNARYSQGRP